MEEEFGDCGGVILKYRVAFGHSYEISKAASQLNESVEGYMHDGFYTYGSLQVVYGESFFTLFQVMIKE